MPVEAGRYDMRIQQGANFSRVITITDENDVPWNLTNWTARLMIRKPKSSTVTLMSLTHTDGLALGGAAGTVTITRSASQTAALDWVGDAHYDLELISDGGVVERVLEGLVTLSKEVSR